MRQDKILMLAVLLLVTLPGNAQAAESDQKEAPLRLTLVSNKTALVQNEPLCLNVVLTATQEVQVARPRFSGHGKALRLYITRTGEDKRRLEWEDTGRFKQGVVRLKPGEKLTYRLCIWWDLASRAFPFAEAGRYALSARLQVQVEGPQGKLTQVDLSSPAVHMDVAHPSPEARQAYALMEQLGAMMRAQKYGKPLREILTKIVEKHPDTRYARFAAWKVAQTLARNEQDAAGLQRMANYLELAIRNPRKDKVTEESVRLLLSVYNELKQLNKARDCAALYLRLFPNGQHMDDIAEWQQRKS